MVISRIFEYKNGYVFWCFGGFLSFCFSLVLILFCILCLYMFIYPYFTKLHFSTDSLLLYSIPPRFRLISWSRTYQKKRQRCWPCKLNWRLWPIRIQTVSSTLKFWRSPLQQRSKEQISCRQRLVSVCMCMYFPPKYFKKRNLDDYITENIHANESQQLCSLMYGLFKFYYITFSHGRFMIFCPKFFLGAISDYKEGERKGSCKSSLLKIVHYICLKIRQFTWIPPLFFRLTLDYILNAWFSSILKQVN